MTTPASPPSDAAGSDRLVAAGHALAAVRHCASAAAEDILNHVPDTGDHVAGRAVDDFVEQASDALRVVAERLTETLDRLVGDRLGGDRRRGREPGWGS